MANVPARSDSAALPAFDATSTYKTAAPIASGQPDGPPTVPAISPNGGAVATEDPASAPSKMEDVPQQTPPKEEPPKKESYPGLSHSPIDPPRAEHQPISQDGDGTVATEMLGSRCLLRKNLLRKNLIQAPHIHLSILRTLSTSHRLEDLPPGRYAFRAFPFNADE